MKISIVTPCFNSVRFIEETIFSVLNQSYENIEYIVIDGGSTDGTLDIIRRYEDRLAYWCTEPDLGMYDAIAKGLEKATGEVHCYLNSDDIYLANTFRSVIDIFTQLKHVSWIHGRSTKMLANGLVFSSGLSVPFRRKRIRKGIYNYNKMSIQQESTFWRSSLTRVTDMSTFRRHRFAGDAYLWSTFAVYSDLYIVNAQFAAFRQHPFQLSHDRAAYNRELKDSLGAKRAFTVKAMRRLFSFMPNRIKLRLFRRNYIVFDNNEMKWRCAKQL